MYCIIFKVQVDVLRVCSVADHTFMQFFGDDFLRVLLLRHVFCYAVLRLHRGFRGPTFYPTSYPPLAPDELLEQPTLLKLVLELASLLETRMLFHELGELD